MKKEYNIDKIPSFRFCINIPSGFSSLLNDVGKAEIYLFGQWVGWDNIYFKKERDYLESIDKFFSYVNYPTYFQFGDIERLDKFNKSQMAKKMFEHLSGWIFNFRDCTPNSDHFLIKGTESAYQCFFELRPEYGYDVHTMNRYINRYRYEYFCNSGSGPDNEIKYISAREGADLIMLMRLSFRSMIYNYKEQHSSEIRVFSGWHNFKEDLLSQCQHHNLL